MSDLIVEASKSVSGNKLLTVEIRRDSSSGLKIFVQSSGDYWKPFRRDDSSTILIGGVVCWRPKSDILRGIPGMFLCENAHEYDETPNLMLFLAKDINAGVWFDFGCFPISEQKIREFVEALRKQAKMLYICFCKPVGTRAEFTTSLIDKEIFD